MDLIHNTIILLKQNNLQSYFRHFQPHQRAIFGYPHKLGQIGCPHKYLRVKVSQLIWAAGWFTYFRFYGPKEAYFDKSWQLPDLDEVK
jgi:hypothetical protein